VRILDLSSVIMGPYATQTLGDMGADVITIEDAKGDTNRSMGPGPHPELSGVSLNLLRNKRNVSLDLKHRAGRDAYLRIAATCDVVVTNLRPAPLRRLGLAYDDVCAVRPDVVFCQAHGWATGSGRENDPAYDDIIQSATGFADLNGRVIGERYLATTLMADKVCGLTMVSSVLAGLYHRATTGEGQHIEVPMYDVMRSFMLVEHGAGAIPSPPFTSAGYERILTAERRSQRTLDGWINMLPYHKQHYETVFAAAGQPGMGDDPRLETARDRIANADSLYRDLARVVATKTTAEWLEICAAHGVPATAIGSVDELVAQLPVVEHPVGGPYHEIPLGVRFSKTPGGVRRPAPLIGQHGREVLVEVGYTSDEIDGLVESGVLRVPAEAG
jgi:crotonobetainyl-CoA:carnitine CoA-transferase CaiB-like acyl-CoA transferase